MIGKTGTASKPNKPGQPHPSAGLAGRVGQAASVQPRLSVHRERSTHGSEHETWACSHTQVSGAAKFT